MRLFYNVNRSGRGSSAISKDAIQGVISPDVNAPAASDLLTVPCELVVMDCSGVILNPEDVILALEHPVESEPVYYAMLVLKASETNDQINYRIVLPLELAAISEPFGDSKRDVTIRVKFPLIKSLTKDATSVLVMNIPYVDRQVFRQKAAVFVPDGIDVSINASAISWTSSISVSDTTAPVMGNVTYTVDSESIKYLAMRTPLCNLVGEPSTASRLVPELRLTFPTLMRSQSVLTDLGFPIALSKDGAKLYFDCYKSVPAGDDPQSAPIMSFGFCSPEDPFTVLDTLGDVMVITVGPEDYDR